MAVFTPVTLPALQQWAGAHYGLGQASALAPISEGIENTNYRATLDGTEYVLTIFELWDSEAVGYYAALMQHLQAAGLPVPAALAGSSGALHHSWEGKPALLVPFAAGRCVEAPDAAHCRQIGELIAAMHRAVADFAARHENPRGSGWRQQAAAQVRPHLSAEQQRLLDSALAADAKFCALPLPQAACHCDLFRSNVLWQEGSIAAVIDFYFGGEDSLVYDLAVCVCSWCYRAGEGSGGGDFDDALLSALIGGYNSQRQLCSLERESFIDALNSAAVRFWLSRHYDILFPRAAQALTPHDPRHFEKILRTIQSRRASLAQLMQKAA